MSLQEREPSSVLQEALAQAFSAYPFHADPEYQAGLAAILGHPQTQATDEEIAENQVLVEKAQFFYFARKYNLEPTNPENYQSWLASSSSTPSPAPGTATASTPSNQPPPPPSTLISATTSTLSPTAQPFTPTPISNPTAPSSQPQPQPQPSSSSPPPDPPYPTSFATIVDLIKRNIPVPGIEEVPSTVLEPGSSKVDKTPWRKKPWEADRDEADEEEEGEEEVKKDSSDGRGEREGKTNGRCKGAGIVDILKPSAVPESGLLARE